jgi:hypothetical protein
MGEKKYKKKSRWITHRDFFCGYMAAQIDKAAAIYLSISA